ncbi:MAG: hypothetical protein K1X88_24860 [Nannocystaceae bacterium]|nr:hypothetical protein [Nannocystaceae bacterium]
MDPRSTAATLAAFALVGGLLQILASAVLGMERLDALTAASQEGPWMYLAAAAGVVAGCVALWILRRRPMIAALSFLLWQAAILWPLSRRMSWVGLALHGEFLLHHFIATACACATLVLAWAVVRERGRGAMRWPAAVCLVVAALAGAWGHLAQVRGAVRAEQLGHGLVVVATLAASALLVGRELIAQPRSRTRWAAAVLLAPLAVRALASGPFALAHAPVPPGLRAPFLGLLVLAAAALTVLLRPRPPRAIAIGMTLLSALSVATLYLVYRGSFGKLEDGLGPLVQSMLGFLPPYPEAVPTLVLVTVMVGAFLALQTAGGSLSADDARDRGIGLALVMVAGVGWSNPQLVLMSGVGLTLFAIDLDGVQAPPRPPPRPLAQVFDELARMLQLEASTVAADRRGRRVLHALRGVHRGLPLELRAELDGERASVRGHIGSIGRGRPDALLVPGPGANRPAHPLARTHAVQGSLRVLEHHGEGLLDACLPFSTLTLGLSGAGAEFSFGDDLHGFDDAPVAALLRALARSYAEDEPTH